METKSNGAAYSEMVEFLKSSPTRQQIIDFSVSTTTRQRVRYLMGVSCSGTISQEERTELSEFQRVENFLYQLKIRARNAIRQS